MFLGHFALAFAAKPAAPKVNLATLFAAAQLPDLIWPVLVAAGVERVAIAPGITAFTPLDFISYPWSHSLALDVVWGVLFAGVHRARTRRRAEALRNTSGYAAATSLLAALVVSHWLLDFVSHRPDMPIVPGGPRYGLGLWNSVPLTLAVEGALFVAGVWIYARATVPDREGRWALASLVGVMVLAYVSSALSAPPSVTAIWSASIAGGLLLIAWAAWTDRHRAPVRQ